MLNFIIFLFKSDVFQNDSEEEKSVREKSHPREKSRDNKDSNDLKKLKDDIIKTIQ